MKKRFWNLKSWYNAASMVIVSKYFLNGNPIWQTLFVKSCFFSSWNKEKRSLTLLSMSHYLKFSFSEKATKIWKNIPLVLTLLSKKKVLSKQVGDFFPILWPSHNVLTLMDIENRSSWAVPDQLTILLYKLPCYIPD